MKKIQTLVASFLLLLVANTQPALAAEAEKAIFTLAEVVVTAPAVSEPLTVVTDPKAPRQPVPAADGGGYLKNIPGFSTVRKGGTASDPVLRGLGGTRLNVLLDGTNLLGGCPSRMDPTTAYVFPESYDRITVIKGPESVQYGGGNIAGTVQFERYTPRLEKAGIYGSSSLLYGSFGRNDQLLDVTAGDFNGFVRIIRSRSHSDNYKDGSGQTAHSFYTRNSLTAILGWTPDHDTRWELALDTSVAEAAYADRSMDGARFDKSAYSLKYERQNLSPYVRSLDFKAYLTYVDHVMDNYSLRPAPVMPMSMNVDRTTAGGRLAAELAVDSKTVATVGLDYQQNKHTGNMVSGTDYKAKPKTPDMTFENYGLFTEFKRTLNTSDRLHAGLRFDSLDVTYAKYPGRTDTDTTQGAFLRYEHDYARAPLTSYIGVGHAERPADWWERRKTGWDGLSPEKNTQLDTGLLYRAGKLNASVAFFYSNIDDFILVTNSGSSVHNIDAALYGGEAEVAYKLAKNWTAAATLAAVHGRNKTDSGPLAQMPPLEGTLALRYDNDKLGAGVLWRGVKAQNRLDVGSGSEIGTDIGPSAGFGILSVNASYRPNKEVLFTAGVDNIFNKNYAEFISRTGEAINSLGISQTVRVNEPGRTIWVKASYTY